jgi:hypothetical protein
VVGQRAAHARELKTPIAPENLRKTLYQKQFGGKWRMWQIMP